MASNESGSELRRAAERIGRRLAGGTRLKAAVFESLGNDLGPEEWVILDDFGATADDETVFVELVRILESRLAADAPG